MGRVNLLGCFIDNLSTEETLNDVDRFIDSKEPHQVVAINAAKIVKMRQDIRLTELINSSDLNFADGQAVLWASKFLSYPLKERIAGIDLMHKIVKRAFSRKYSLYFLGAKQEIVKKTVNRYRKEFPKINILGWHNGYFKSGDEEQEIIEEIRNLKPNILFVAMGTPKKEFWIRDNLTYLGVPVCMGVGGSFDIIAGITKRAPKWMQRVGLEWFFRFLNEPGRMWKRYLVTNSAFIWLVLRRKLRQIKNSIGEKKRDI